MTKTRAQLLNVLLDAQWAPADVAVVARAHGLAERLFTAQVRADGQPFLDHLVGTAGVVAAAGGDAVMCSAALLHSAYLLGDFGDGARGMTAAKRAEVRDAIGVHAEGLVAAYSGLRWNLSTMRELAAEVESLPEETRRLVVLRVANALDDHRDLGMRYRGCSGPEVRADPEIPVIIALAEGVGCAALAQELRRAVEAEVSAEIPSALLTRRDDCYAVRPRSTRLRPVAWLRAEETPVARVAHRWLWRARRSILGR